MDKIEKLKKFLQEHYPNIQAFNTRNIVRDYMVNVYDKDNIQVDYCYDYGYIEIFGLTDEEFYSLIEDGHLKNFNEYEEKKMEYKIGDKVKVRSDLKVDKQYDQVRFDREMKKYKGKIVTIARILSDNCYQIEENGEVWCWSGKMFEPVENEIPDIEVGDRVSWKFKSKDVACIRLVGDETDIHVIKNNMREVLKIERVGKNGWETIYEKPKEILDEVEKEYLWNLVKPFRYKIKKIVKRCPHGEYIQILLKGEGPIQLPYFKKGTKYKGMEENKEYTLKELGLVEE